MTGYRTALLEHFQERETRAFDLVEAAGGRRHGEAARARPGDRGGRTHDALRAPGPHLGRPGRRGARHWLLERVDRARGVRPAAVPDRRRRHRARRRRRDDDPISSWWGRAHGAAGARGGAGAVVGAVDRLAGGTRWGRPGSCRDDGLHADATRDDVGDQADVNRRQRITDRQG
ncbi:hypothetical protein HBB16_18555 [Pseudonocardia sp. MCCB 268]|nr:hypothetical protein [Pseudonocardia cytotoxica]